MRAKIGKAPCAACGATGGHWGSCSTLSAASTKQRHAEQRLAAAERALIEAALSWYQSALDDGELCEAVRSVRYWRRRTGGKP